MSGDDLSEEPCSTGLVLGCPVTDAHFAQWSRQFICDPAPFFLSDETQMPSELLLLTRQEFAESRFSLTYQDSYLTYSVAADTRWVALVTSDEFDSLPPHSQQHLLAAQWALNRGHVYPWNQVENDLQGCLQRAQSRCFSVGDTSCFVLDAAIWSLLPEAVRRRWLLEFITSGDPPVCLSSGLSAADWAAIHHPVIQRLAGTFPAQSGANCFSTTLAAITSNPHTAATTAEYWVHQSVFLRGLALRGFTERPEMDALAEGLRDAVLVWFDAKGKAQHACYVIGDGRVFNKNAQGWYAPWQILDLNALLAYWADDPFTTVVYQRVANG